MMGNMFRILVSLNIGLLRYGLIEVHLFDELLFYLDTSNRLMTNIV